MVNLKAKLNKRDEGNHNNIFFLFTTLLAITPCKSNERFVLWYKIYSLLFVAGLLYGFYFMMAEKMADVLKQSSNVSITVQLICYGSLLMCNVLITLEVTFLQNRTYNQLLEEIKSVRKMLKMESSRAHSNGVAKDVVLAHVIVGIVSGLDIYLMTMKENVSYFLLFDMFQKYRISILHVLISYLMKDIQLGFRYVNDHLEDIISNESKIYTDVDNTFFCLMKKEFPRLNKAKDLNRTVNSLSIAYTKLSDAVNMLNGCFGWNMLLLILYFIAYFLMSFHASVSNDGAQGDNLSAGFICWCVASFTFTVWGLAGLATTSNHALKESTLTSTLAYTLLQRVDTSEGESEENGLRENLILLTRQASVRSPVFSAAGFFNVNCAMLYILLQLIVSYIVVLIQFAKF